MRFPKLEKDARVDVAVVGGGMAGISCAYHLNKKGYKVLLLEQDQVGSAASGASSGVLYYGSGTNYAPAVEIFGQSKARALWTETAKVIEEICAMSKSDKLDCEFRRCGAIMVAKTEEEVSELEQETLGLKGAGISTKILWQDELKSFFPLAAFKAGITFDAVGQITPAKFASGLAKIHGPEIYEGSPASDWSEGPDGVVVRTPGGTIKCDHAVIATNTQPYFGLDAHFEMESSVILASQPTEVGRAFPKDKIFWTMEERYDMFYPREGRLVMELYELGYEEEKFAQYFPGIEFRIEQQWGDVWAKTKDFMPIVGRVSPNVSVAVAMGDQGIIMSWLTGKNMTDAIQGKSNWFLEMTSPSRFKAQDGVTGA